MERGIKVSKLMKTLLLILLSFSLSGQILTKKQTDWVTRNDDAVHFYAVVAVGELSHGIQKLVFKEQSFGNRLLWDWIISQAAIFGKETYDCYKANPTGFNWNDVAPGELGCHVRLMFKVSWNDFKQVGFVPRKKKDNYSMAKDL